MGDLAALTTTKIFIPIVLLQPIPWDLDLSTTLPQIAVGTDYSFSLECFISISVT